MDGFCQHKNDISSSLCLATHDAKFTQQLTVTLEISKKIYHDNLKQQNQSLRKKKKIHCDIWNALFFTNVIDHWL